MNIITHESIISISYIIFPHFPLFLFFASSASTISLFPFSLTTMRYFLLFLDFQRLNWPSRFFLSSRVWNIFVVGFWFVWYFDRTYLCFLVVVNKKKEEDLPGVSSHCRQRPHNHAEGKTGRKCEEDDQPPSHSRGLSTQDPPLLYISGRMEEVKMFPDPPS